MVVEPDSPQRIARLTPLSDVLARLDGLVRPVAPRASDLSGALGSTLAEDVVAMRPVPATARALRDGWAVRADHTTDAGTYAPAPLPAAARIDVGQPLAGDADAVTPLDALTVRNGMAQALAPVGPGDGVLSAGADVAVGAVLMEAGRRLARPQIEVLAAAGSRPCAFAPRDCVWCALGRAATPSSMPRSPASPMPSEPGAALPSRPGRMTSHTRSSIRPSMRSWWWAAPAAAGATPRAHARVDGRGVRARGGLLPGETTAFGAIGSRPVLALPGRLDAALAAWHLLGQVMLARLAGSREPECQRTAKLTHKVSSTVGLSELVPVRCEGVSRLP
jgi:molybdopterin biosynthesis enzyme